MVEAAEIKTAIQGALKEAISKITSGTTPDLAAAFVKFWGDVLTVKKDAQNPHLKNDYATLGATLAAIKGPLTANGLAVLQCPGTVRDGTMALTTMVIHKSGQSWQFTTELPFGEGTDKKTGLQKPATPQNAGSVITYARRYTLQALAGISPIDDDGEEASVIEHVEEESAPTGPSVDQLKTMMLGFKPNKNEKVKDCLARFKTEFETLVAATADRPLVEEYVAHRSRLKALFVTSTKE